MAVEIRRIGLLWFCLIWGMYIMYMYIYIGCTLFFIDLTYILFTMWFKGELGWMTAIS